MLEPPVLVDGHANYIIALNAWVVAAHRWRLQSGLVAAIAEHVVLGAELPAAHPSGKHGASLGMRARLLNHGVVNRLGSDYHLAILERDGLFHEAHTSLGL